MAPRVNGEALCDLCKQRRIAGEPQVECYSCQAKGYLSCCFYVVGTNLHQCEDCLDPGDSRPERRRGEEPDAE